MGGVPRVLLPLPLPLACAEFFRAGVDRFLARGPEAREAAGPSRRSPAVLGLPRLRRTPHYRSAGSRSSAPHMGAAVWRPAVATRLAESAPPSSARRSVRPLPAWRGPDPGRPAVEQPGDVLRDAPNGRPHRDRRSGELAGEGRGDPADALTRRRSRRGERRLGEEPQT